MSNGNGTKPHLDSQILFLRGQLDLGWKRIDFLNLYIFALQQQIRAMGGVPIMPEKEK